MSDETPRDDLAPLAQRFQELRDLIDRISGQIRPGAPRTTAATIARYRGEVYAAMDALGNAMHALDLTSPSPERMAAARRLVVDPILEWSSTSPVLSRGQQLDDDPFGQHELVQLLLDAQIAGADPPASILNDYYVYSRSSKAFRNLLQLVGEQLHAEVLRSLTLGIHSLQIVCLQYVGGAELMALADDLAIAGKVQVTCLSSSPTAIRHAMRTLRPVLTRGARFHKTEAQRWLEGPDCERRSASVVYAVSLFDRLNAAAVVKIMQGAYQHLREGGVLLAGFATPNLPVGERTVREWVLQPQWHFRTEQEIRAMLDQTPFTSKRAKFEYESLGVDLLLTVRRTD